ncbi:MAG: hypothetical protein R3B70_26020 [Polyangiaceae bacterium]
MLALAAQPLPASADTASPKPLPPSQAPIPRYRLNAQSTLGFSYNGLGVEERARLGMQMLLYRSENPAFRDNFVFIGAGPRLNPISVRAGPTLEIQPLTVFNLQVNLEFIDYFGTFNSLAPYTTPLADFSQPRRDAAADRGENYGTTGVRFSISPFVQAKVGPIVVRNRFTLEYYSIAMRRGHTTYYDPAIDTLVPAHGVVLSNDLDVFYLKELPHTPWGERGRIVAGLRYTAFDPLFKPTDFAPGEPTDKDPADVHRVGPLLAFTFFDDGFTRFHEPTIAAIFQWFAAHKNRTGKDEHQAVPYIVLAFTFQSDLWVSN